MIHKKLINEEYGISLIEVMVTIVLVTIAIIPLLNFFTNNTKIVHQQAIRSQAINLARNAVEDLRHEAIKDWDNLDTTASHYSLDDCAGDNDLKTNYDINVNLTDFDSQVKKISITISWNSYSNSIVLDTLVRKR